MSSHNVFFLTNGRWLMYCQCSCCSNVFPFLRNVFVYCFILGFCLGRLVYAWLYCSADDILAKIIPDILKFSYSPSLSCDPKKESIIVPIQNSLCILPPVQLLSLNRSYFLCQSMSINFFLNQVANCPLMVKFFN